MKGFTREYDSLEILSDQQVEDIHWGTLEVLEETGVRFESERAMKLLEDSGCRIDRDEMQVRFPPALVEGCLRRCASSFHVKAGIRRTT